MTEEWAVPTAEDVSKVVGYLIDDNLRHHFFAQLQNPHWVSALDQLGVFDDLPAVSVDDQGLVRAGPWPAGDYLARMAPAEPALVAGILTRLPESENPWVNAALLDAALLLPPPHGAALANKIAGAVRRGWRWVDADALLRLAERLASDHPEAVRTLLAASYEPRRGVKETAALGTTTRVAGGIEDYWYSEFAPRVAQLLASQGSSGLRLATGWLLRALEISDHTDAAAYIWRPSIAPHAQNQGSDEVMDALVDVVRDVAVSVANEHSTREVVEFLERFGPLLTRRIALEITAQAIESAGNDEALSVGARLLLEESLLDLDARPEYVHLAKAALPRLTDDERAAWQAVIRAEHWQGPGELVAQMASRAAERDPPSAEDIARVRRRLTYRLLLPIGEALPAPERDLVGELKVEFGELEHPEFATYMTSFSGPTSPLDHAALAQMSPEDLYAFLRDWEPDDRRGFGPSRDGLGRELAVVAQRQPDLVGALAPQLLELPRAFVRGALSGWAKAVQEGLELPSAVWELMARLAGMSDVDDDSNVGVDDDDPVWRWAQREALDVVTAYLEAAGEPLDGAGARRAWAVIRPLTHHPDPTPAHEAQYGGTNMDPLTLSLNTTRPAALRAATKLVRRLPSDGDAEAAAIRTELLDELAQHVGPSDDPSLAVAAVFGEALGLLAHNHREWFDEHGRVLLDVVSRDPSTRARADVAVSVALRIYRTNGWLIDVLGGVIDHMFSPTYAAMTHVEGWEGRRPAVVVAATHVLNGYLLGLLDQDDPLLMRLTEADASPGVFADALGHIGWDFMRALRGGADSGDGARDSGRVAPGVVDRARQLIDNTVEAIQAGHAPASQLSGFYWWVRSGAFDPAWWLPILRLAASDPSFDPKGLLGESLEAAADRHPAPVLEVFDALRRRADGWERHDMLRHAPAILAAALRANDEPTRERANRILDDLGRAGHLSILEDVDRIVGPAT